MKILEKILFRFKNVDLGYKNCRPLLKAHFHQTLINYKKILKTRVDKFRAFVEKYNHRSLTHTPILTRGFVYCKQQPNVNNRADFEQQFCRT